MPNLNDTNQLFDVLAKYESDSKVKVCKTIGNFPTARGRKAVEDIPDSMGSRCDEKQGVTGNA